MRSGSFRSIIFAPGLLALVAPAVLAQTQLFELAGDGPSDLFGVSVGRLGDIDGDGVPEFLVGADQSPHTLGLPPTGPGYARVFSGAFGTELFTLVGDTDDDWFGSAVAGLGDVDGDGTPDFAVTAMQPGYVGYPPQVPGTPPGLGYARLFSGADGSVIRTHTGIGLQDEYGGSAAGAGDVDGDGFPDLVVGARYNDGAGPSAGAALVYSGASGFIVHLFFGKKEADRFGAAVAGAGDVDLDGRADVLASATGADIGFPTSGTVEVRSGADGSVLHAWHGDSTADSLGNAVAGGSDVDGDGVPDVVVGVRLDDLNGASSGTVDVYSGSDGALLASWSGASQGDGLGVSVDFAGDVDGDDVPDVVAGAWMSDDPESGAGSVRVFSGASGAVLAVATGKAESDLFGAAVAGAGDLNGDGLGDVLAGAYVADPSGDKSGAARALTGVPMSFDTNLYQLSLASGGEQRFGLHAGPLHGGKLHLVLGSAAGNSPGIPVGSFQLPLNPDAYFLYTLTNPGHAPLAGGLGTLNASGDATATLVVPAGSPPGLAGVSMHHAFALLSGISEDFVSNAVPLTLTP